MIKYFCDSRFKRLEDILKFICLRYGRGIYDDNVMFVCLVS